MKMPGFSGEASLYTYRSTAPPCCGDSFGISPDRRAVVEPQLRKTDYECVHDCLEAGGGDMCNFFCTENVDDGGGGGGGGQSCRPECGPCHSDLDSPTGRSRTCVRADCETYDRQCSGIPVLKRSGVARWT